MSNGITIQAKGFDKVLKSMRGLGEDVRKEAQMEFRAAADETRQKAVVKAPADESGLRQSISVKRAGGNYEVVVQKGYAAYMEFGTKSKFRAPKELGTYPYRFIGKGQGGNPITSLRGWVKRKGIAKGKEINSVAFLIYQKIKREGVTPHPYLFPAFFEVRGKLLGRLRRIVKDAIK